MSLRGETNSVYPVYCFILSFHSSVCAFKMNVQTLFNINMK